jgi:caffeoyl-CoA O-methyltransferase
MDIIHPSAQEYAERFTSPSDNLLHQVEQDTVATHPQAHMISGHLQGKFLEFISIITKPQRILEIGTFTGFSALSLLKGLAPNGELHTIELREEDAARARQNFHKAKGTERIILHVGNALDIIPTLGGNWDLVFIDADKVNYTRYYDLVLPIVNSGGLILADNVLFHGEVLEQPITGKNGKAINEFNEHVSRDERVEQVVVTIRDGLMLIRKK